MAKKIMAVLMITAMICVMILPAYAAGTFNSELYYVTWSEGTTSYKRYYQITGFPYTLSYIGASDSYYLYLCFKTNQIILDGSIIVIALTLNDILPNDITVLGVAPSTSGTLPSNSTVYPSAFERLNLNQEIIASTIKQTGNSTTVTVTFRASGFNNMYPIIGYRNVIRLNSNTAITMANCSLYETIEEAAGSGTTPEEMREVLSSWGEEELIPGIQDSVQSGVQSGMEAALKDEKQQANTDGNSAIDELTGALNGVVDDIEQVQTSFQSLGAALSYTGQSAVLSVPAIVVPGMGQISDARTFNLTQEIDNIVPSALLTAIRAVLSLSLISYPIIELIKQLRKLLSN